MSRRVTPIVFALCALFVLAGLLAAAAGDRRATAFAPGVPDNVAIATLRPGQWLCQGPVAVPAKADAVQVWVSPAQPLEVQVRRAPRRRPLAALRLVPPASPTGRITIPVAVPAGARITICMRDAGDRPVAFEGGAPAKGSGELTLAGQRTAYAIALLFLRPRPPSLLSLLPQVFRRAGLFKLDGVGAWTFWLLSAALLGAVALGGIAVSDAARADAAEDEEP